MIYIALTFDEAISHQIDEVFSQRIFWLWLCRIWLSGYPNSNENNTFVWVHVLCSQVKRDVWLRICPNLNPPQNFKPVRNTVLSSPKLQIQPPSRHSHLSSSIEAVNSLSFSWTVKQNCCLPTWCLEPCSSICRTIFLLTKPPCWQRVRVGRSTRLNRCTKMKIAGSSEV